MGITKQDIAAMKNANSVFFGYRKPGYGEYINTPEGFYVRARREARDSSTGYDEEHVFSIDGRIANSKGDVSWAGDSLYTYDAELRTILSLLRQGDELVVHFFVSNDSENIRKANMTADEMRLEIVRPLPSGKTKRMSFNLTYRIVPVGSSARMVKYVSEFVGA